MSTPNTPNIPGIGAMSDTLDFVKNLWGGMAMPGMNIPGMVMPTLSVDEINKQIKDLKAVESWLTLNLNMLHGSIQALEVQASTISTLQSMSKSFTTAMQPEKETASAFESPFASTPAKPKAPAEQPAPQQAHAPAPAAPEKAPKPATESAGAATNPAPQMANPAVWWNMLQDQFKQAVDTASSMTPEMPGAAKAKSAQPAKPAPAVKPAKAAAAKKTAAPKKRKAAPKA